MDPEHFILGIFYFNPDDERIWVPKRYFPIGRTLNLAHWQSWVFLALVAILFVLSLVGYID